jgi:hypothetical protein
VDDVAAVLRHRVEMWAGSRSPDDAAMVGGLISRAAGVTDPDLARALVEREQAMERRGHGLVADPEPQAHEAPTRHKDHSGSAVLVQPDADRVSARAGRISRTSSAASREPRSDGPSERPDLPEQVGAGQDL